MTLALLLCILSGHAQQKFFNLTAQQVRVDSLLPYFSYAFPLKGNYADSVYTVVIKYPEYIDMSAADVKRCRQMTGFVFGESPLLKSNVVVERKQGWLETGFVPVVVQGGKYRKLVSFMLQVNATAKESASRAAGIGVQTRSSDASARYAAHSVLSSGTWVKVSVPSSGIYQLTETLVRKAGFSNINKVKIYGYGGALQPEVLDGDYLYDTDDLKELPTCTVNGRRLFYAQGPVSWRNGSAERIRNPYSDVGCYFLTQSDDEPLSIDSTTFINTYYPSTAECHTLHEVDNYAWFEGGRNLFEDDPISVGSPKTYTVAVPKAGVPTSRIFVALSAGVNSSASVTIDGQECGTQYMSIGSTYEKGSSSSNSYYSSGGFSTEGRTYHEVTITPLTGGPIRLDYIAAYTQAAPTVPNLSGGSFGVPDVVGKVDNQDLHADSGCQMIIIIPSSQHLREQAERLKTFHETVDDMKVKLVPANQLYNEFSSGTPDANAYRRYLKMLYDRAQGEADMPKYLLLFGDCAWDNRMNSAAWSGYSPDNYLLCYESENSFSEVYCYVDDGWFCLLDDGEGGNAMGSDRLDMAVGRFPVRTAEDAKVMVDKTIAYAANEDAGAWQNTVMVMGDDGNNNNHMDHAEEVAQLLGQLNPGLLIKKVMWDSYTRTASSTGYAYPEATAAIRQQQQNGALIMNYSGHGSETSISHERVLTISDFQNFTNTHLPLWITASCEIMPFDSQMETIGEEAVLNKKGGAVAFFGTTRTVYVERNKIINKAFLRALFTPQNGKFISIGEAQRISKNNLLSDTISLGEVRVVNPDGQDLTVNKLQYSLLGDPALVLHIPTLDMVVDSINGVAVGDGMTTIKAGMQVTVKGHVERNKTVATDFNGQMTATVRDSEEKVVCKLNDDSDDSGAEEPFEYYDRNKTLFSGSDSVRSGRFQFVFAVPKDINYSDKSGMINLYAVNNSHTELGNGFCDDFNVGGSNIISNDSIGPSIFCYLNSPDFTDGGQVNATPYFVAQISDKDGLNTTGNGIGHDLELIIDGDMAKTYNLNDNFSYDFGSYTSGSTFYQIPELEEGMHRLLFRAWDMLNNSSKTELSFRVIRALEPVFNIGVTVNPAKESTTFIVNHDRTGSVMDMAIEVLDMSGRLLWSHQETGVAGSSTYTYQWNVAMDGGQRLETGVYLYRVRMSCDGSSTVSKAKKLIVIQ